MYIDCICKYIHDSYKEKVFRCHISFLPITFLPKNICIVVPPQTASTREPSPPPTSPPPSSPPPPHPLNPRGYPEDLNSRNLFLSPMNAFLVCHWLMTESLASHWLITESRASHWPRRESYPAWGP